VPNMMTIGEHFLKL